MEICNSNKGVRMAVAPQGDMAKELPFRIDELTTARVWLEAEEQQ